MKTLTEFSGFVLKEAIAKKAAFLAEGKTEEEVTAALNEFLKLDESKTGFYKNVVDMTSSRMDRVKRVVVALKASETEKVPESYIEREGHFYLVEYFTDPNARPSRGRDDRDDGRRGGGRGRGGNDRGGRGNARGNDRGNDRGRDSGDRSRDSGFRSERSERTAPAPRVNATQSGAPGFISTGEGVAKPSRPETAKRPPRPKRDPNAPREPRAPRGPKGAGELRLVLKGQSATMLQGSGPAVSAAPAGAESTQATSEQPQA